MILNLLIKGLLGLQPVQPDNKVNDLKPDDDRAGTNNPKNQTICLEFKCPLNSNTGHKIFGYLYISVLGVWYLAHICIMFQSVCKVGVKVKVKVGVLLM